MVEMYRIQDEEIVGVSRADARRRQGFSRSIPNQSLSLCRSLPFNYKRRGAARYMGLLGHPAWPSNSWIGPLDPS